MTLHLQQIVSFFCIKSEKNTSKSPVWHDCRKIHPPNLLMTHDSVSTLYHLFICTHRFTNLQSYLIFKDNCQDCHMLTRLRALFFGKSSDRVIHYAAGACHKWDGSALMSLEVGQRITGGEPCQLTMAEVFKAKHKVQTNTLQQCLKRLIMCVWQWQSVFWWTVRRSVLWCWKFGSYQSEFVTFRVFFYSKPSVLTLFLQRYEWWSLWLHKKGSFSLMTVH